MLTNRITPVVVVVFLTLSTTLKAQLADPRPAFHSINNIGLLNGSESAALQLQTIEGFGYKNWYAGLGAALDYYRYRTVPVFMDLRHTFGKTGNKWFVYADGGFALPWVTKKQKNLNVLKDKFSGRLYYDLGAGYQITIGKRNAILLSAGYSQMKLHEETTPYQYSYDLFPTPANPGNPTDRYDYRLKRLVIKLGLTL